MIKILSNPFNKIKPRFGTAETDLKLIPMWLFKLDNCQEIKS